MTNSREKLINVYLHILNYYSSGGSAFVILKTLREEYQRNQEKEDDIFLGTVVISCFNSVIIVLANTIKPNSDSIHLYYLFNCIKNSKELFNPKTYNQLVSMISEVELELKKLSNITDIVIKYRDTTVAHLDRNHVNKPEFLLENPPIKWNDMELVYNIIGSSLIEIGKFFNINFQDILTISNFELAKRTRLVFNSIYS